MNWLRNYRNLLSPAPVLAALLVFCAISETPPLVAQEIGCTAPDWDITTLYQRGTLVTHESHEWRAKRRTEGVEPGTHKPTWQDLGLCDTEPPPDPGDPPPQPVDPEPLQIFGIWHAGNHYADWSVTQTMAEFDDANHWIIDRGDGKASVNLVVLSFLDPRDVLNMDPDDPTTGVPDGMTGEIVEYFRSRNSMYEEGDEEYPYIRVMMSIGGVTYTDYWDEALATHESATRLGLNAAAIADHFNVGIEIDYERNVGANLAGLENFINAYRSVHGYDAEGTNHAARLTIDLAAGGRYLQELNRYATIHWLDNSEPVLDYANAMVHRKSGSPANWQEHIDGMPTYDPVIPPKAPNRFTGGLYLKGDDANCLYFEDSEQAEHAGYVQTVAPNGAGTTNAMLGYMFWAAGTPTARKNYTPTVPPNTCEDGMGVAMDAFQVDVPMRALRQN
jgi:hypothetical protein